MVARFAPARSCLAGSFQRCTCRSGNGRTVRCEYQQNGFASRDTAPCCARTHRQVLEARACVCWCFSRQLTCAEGSERLNMVYGECLPHVAEREISSVSANFGIRGRKNRVVFVFNNVC